MTLTEEQPSVEDAQPPAPAEAAVTAVEAPAEEPRPSLAVPGPVRPILVTVTPPEEPAAVEEDAARVAAATEAAARKESAAKEGHQGWTIVLICLGIGLIASGLLIPQMNDNRQLMYECDRLKQDLAHLQRQADVNEQFIKQAAGRDPSLSERLAQRQMRFIRKGTQVLHLRGESDEARSALSLVTVPPPPPLPEYQPVTGRLAEACRDPRKRLYMLGSGLMLLAMGLVLGNPQSRDQIV